MCQNIFIFMCIFFFYTVDWAIFIYGIRLSLEKQHSQLSSRFLLLLRLSFLAFLLRIEVFGLASISGRNLFDLILSVHLRNLFFVFHFALAMGQFIYLFQDQFYQTGKILYIYIFYSSTNRRLFEAYEFLCPSSLGYFHKIKLNFKGNTEFYLYKSKLNIILIYRLKEKIYSSSYPELSCI